MKRRVWFWPPQWYWYGLRTLIPVGFGHDEYARKTIVLGWTITGRAIIALWDCGDVECHDDRVKREELAARFHRIYGKAAR